jgi:acetyltransferase-like isoleucine patch superfamily enzyme
VSITSGRHQHNTGNMQAIDADPHFEPVSIGAHAWIGEGAIVMANIGRSSIVGAGSVVTGAVPDGSTVVGNPARRLDRPARNG